MTNRAHEGECKGGKECKGEECNGDIPDCCTARVLRNVPFERWIKTSEYRSLADAGDAKRVIPDYAVEGIRGRSRAKSERTMTRWFVGVKPDGRREVVAESTGTNPTAQLRGYVEMCGPYNTAQQAAKAAKAKPSPDRGSPRHRPQN